MAKIFQGHGLALKNLRSIFAYVDRRNASRPTPAVFRGGAYISGRWTSPLRSGKDAIHGIARWEWGRVKPSEQGAFSVDK